EASTSSAASRARAIAERYAPGQVSSALTVLSGQQIMLEVRILEANRTALKDVGLNIDIDGRRVGAITGTGLYGVSTPQGLFGISTNYGATTIDATLQALEDKGVIRTLARPNLAA